MPHSVFPVRSLSLWVVPLTVAFTQFVSLPSANAAPTIPVTMTKAAEPQAPALQLMVAQGVVRDAEGKPVSGAIVEALNAWAGVEPTRFQRTPVQTDEMGHFTVEARIDPADLSEMRRWLKLADADNSLAVGVYKPGFALAKQLVKTGKTNDAALPTNDITLAHGFSAMGQVVDSEGKPLPAAKVRALYLRPTANDRTTLSLSSFSPDGPVTRAFQTVSDKEGRFTLHDLPLGVLTIALDDPRFVRLSTNFTVMEQLAPPNKDATLTARLAATVRGRVVYPDGKPVAKVAVAVRSALDTSYSSASGITELDGTFVIKGVEPGQVIISAKSPGLDWAGANTSEMTLKASTETDAGTLTLSRGIVLTGYVREEGNKAPVPGTTVTATLAGSLPTSAKTDAQGRYQIRAQPGNITFSIDLPPTDYLGNYNQPQLKVGEQSRTAPDFSLRKGLTFTGTAKDEKGQPATGATVFLGNGFRSNETTVVDAQGNWTLRSVDPNIFGGIQPDGVIIGEMRPDGASNLSVGGAWALRAPARVTRQQKPVALILYPITLQNVKVRVVTPEGKPVTDALVMGKIFNGKEQNSWSYNQFTSDAKGEITLPNMRPEQSAELTATKKGYYLTQSGKVAHEGGDDPAAPAQLRGSDIVMTAMDAKISGRVLDAKGQPASGARVALLFPNNAPSLPDSVLTDEQGRFTLEGLPQGALTIGVAKGRAFGQSVAQANGTIELKLGEDAPALAPQNTKAAFAQLGVWITAAPVGDGRSIAEITKIVVTLTAYDAEWAPRIVTDVTGKLSSSYLSMAAGSLVWRTPQQAASWAKKALPLVANNQASTDIKLRLAILMAAADAEDARQIYDEVTPNVVLGDTSIQAGVRYTELAALAAALKNPDADGWLQALTLWLAAQNTEQDDFVGQLSALLASGDLPTARKWVSQLGLKDQVSALSTLIVWTAKRDLPAARQMLADAEAILTRPEFPVEPARNDGPDRNSPTDQLNSARASVVRALMNTDLKAAQAIVLQLPTNTSNYVALRSEVVARSLSSTRDAETLRAAFKTAGSGWQNPVGNIARMAALVSDTLPQIREEGFAQAREKLADLAEQDRTGEGDPAASYAYARAPFDPAESRLVLESAWLRSMAALKQDQAQADQGDMWQQSSSLNDVARAMVALDLARANEMVALLPTTEAFRYNNSLTRTMTIKWLLADEQTRRTMTLDDSSESREDIF